MLKHTIENMANILVGQSATILLFAAIILGSSIGIEYPDLGEGISTYVDYTVLCLVFCLLFEVEYKNILKSLNRLTFIVSAVVANFVVIPVLGFAFSAFFLQANQLLFVGLMIYFISPCTDWFLGFTRLAKGNTALGAALLPINLVIQLLLYPFYVQLFGLSTLDTDITNIIQTLWQWFLIPLLSAVVIRLLCERLLIRRQIEFLSSLVSSLVPFLLALLVGQMFAANVGTLISHLAFLPLIILAIICFFIATFYLSDTISKFMNFPYEDRVLLTMTTAARNAPLMLALTITVIPDQPLIYVAIITGMLVELPHLIAIKMILLKSYSDGTYSDLQAS